MKDLNKIVNGAYYMPKTISKETVAFLNEMLKYNPSERLNAEQLSHHPFLKKNVLDFERFNEKSIHCGRSLKTNDAKIFIQKK
jgi:serine/threonine protein kinase